MYILYRNLCLTLKVENASDATSKLGNSTNLKNNSKLADSNMYLRNHYKNKLWRNELPSYKLKYELPRLPLKGKIIKWGWYNVAKGFAFFNIEVKLKDTISPLI